MNNFKLMVCPHDTAKNPENWYNFAQYLTQTLSSSVLFEKSIDFPDFHSNLISSGLVYANPQDSLRLIKEHGYIPVARPSNLSDEIIFVATKSLENPKVADIANNNVTSVDSMMVTKVGLKCLLDHDITPSNIDSKESWMAVVKSIFRGETDYAMVYKDFYEGLNSLSRSGLQKIGETTDGTIHHNLLVSQELAEFSDQIQQCLIQMHEASERSQEILAALNIQKLVAVSKDEILNFEALHAYKTQADSTTGQPAIEELEECCD